MNEPLSRQKATQTAQAAVEALIDESQSLALSFLTANFVGLLSAIVSANGGDPNGELKIDGGESRDITVHAKKDFESLNNKKGAGAI